MDKLIAKANTANTDTIKEMIRHLATDFQDGADLVLNTLLSILEGRLGEVEFVAFCAEVEDAL